MGHHLRFCVSFSLFPCAASSVGPARRGGSQNFRSSLPLLLFLLHPRQLRPKGSSVGSGATPRLEPSTPSILSEPTRHQMDTSVIQGPCAIRLEKDNKIEQQQQSQEQQEQAFLAWLRGNGAVFDSLSWPSPVTGSGTRGAVARSGIATGVR